MIYLCDALIPFQTVENDSFKKLLNDLCPYYDLPSRKYLVDNILSGINLEMSDNLKKVLEKSEYISNTSDIWTDISQIPYLGITG